MPRTHVSADAFVRRVLADPADPLPRLVFADWLEESGDPADVAWAHYLRARAGAAEAATERDRTLLRDRAAALPVAARLTLPATVFVPRFLDFFDLLPPPNFTVTLDGFTVPRDVLGPLDANWCRRARGLPLRVARGYTLVGLADPRDWRALGHFSGVGSGVTVAVGVPEDQIGPAVERSRPAARVVLPDPLAHVAVRPPTLADRVAAAKTPGDVRAVLLRLLADVRAEGATAVELMPYEYHTAVRVTLGGRSPPRDELSPGAGRVLVAAAETLDPAEHAVRVYPRNTYFGRAVRVVLLTRPG